MDKLMQVFESQEFGQVRTAMIEDKPYAVGVDVARALGYAKPSQAVIDHCKGIRKLGIPSPGGIQETNMISEGDIYRLIVKAADQSANPEIKARAERFERWIFDEVLPQIRQTGQYAIQPLTQIQVLQQAVNLLAEQERRLASLEAGQAQIRATFAARRNDWRKAVNDGVKAIAEAQQQAHQLVWDEFYRLVEERGHCDLHIRLEHLVARLLAAGATKTKLKLTGRLDVIEEDPVIQEIALAVIKEMQAKYAVEAHHA